MSPNWTAAATLRIPIFEGGKVEADVQQTDAVLKQRQAQVDDMRGRIEQDVEDAILDLKAAAQQVEVAKLGLEYAQQALGQSQDRFAAGVTNNVEVIQAQQQLASANDRFISSLYAHNIAKVLVGARHRQRRTGRAAISGGARQHSARERTLVRATRITRPKCRPLLFPIRVQSRER